MLRAVSHVELALPLQYILYIGKIFLILSNEIFTGELNDREINHFLIFARDPPGTPLILPFNSQEIKLALIEQVPNAHPHVTGQTEDKGTRPVEPILMQELQLHVNPSGRSGREPHRMYFTWAVSRTSG